MWSRVALCVGLSACSFTHGRATGDGSTTGVDGANADSGTASHGYEKAIVVQRAMVAGDVTGFPVWIDLANDSDLATYTRDDHGDVYFTDINGTALPYEITAWDHTTGSLQVWVRATHLTPSQQNPDPNTIYLRFGGPAAPMPSSPAAVFDNGFKAVWHLDGATAVVADATGSAQGTISGPAPGVDTGRLGGALVFSNPSTAITFVNPITGSEASTTSAWVNEAPKGSNVYAYAIVVVGTASTDNARWLYSLYGGDGDSVAAGLYNDDHTPSPHVISTGTWVKLDWVVDGSDNSHLYVDGVEIDAQALGGADTIGTSGVIGNVPPPLASWSGNQGTMAFAGLLDEVRLASTARSANWLRTEYENERAPASFYAIGPRQAL
jgi:hypothetical protein